ncbi:MAG: glutathione S-transferase [Polaromonas sp.]|nr:glutathione S-transferase [Polaromonas sp.]
MNAAALVPALASAQTLPVLYSFRRCPYAMRARLALVASRVNCEIREVALRCKPPELLAASAKATVPVLVLPGGAVIEQSLEIMRWALAQSDPQHWLRPQTGSLAAMLTLISDNDEGFKRHLDRYKYPNRYRLEHAGADLAFAQDHRASASAWLLGLERRLARFSWLFGTSPSLADMAIGPFVRQFARTDEPWFGTQPWPRLTSWLARWESADGFGPMMEKYPPWQSGKPGVAWPPGQTTAPHGSIPGVALR